ncbi:MAG: flagellar hook-length control protein FliK [Pseudorhodobacter sp.]|nr:flagellar hook-length control protein FliK [Pseudorhodobacter sp.]
MPAADQPGPVAAALSVGGDPAPAETPALVIDGAGLARGVAAPGAASKSPDAAPGSSLAPPMVTANQQKDTDQTAPTARNDTAPARIGAKPEFSGPPRPDEGPATDLAFSPTPSPATDPSASAGEAVPALAQILATPIAPSTTASALPFTPHSKPLAATLIEHARNGGTESVELSLAPEELGRLRMSLQPEGDGMRVLLSAERPETIDLMRRHADQLAQEFRQAGFSGATLSFGQWGAGGTAHPQAQAQANPPAAPATVADPSPTAPSPGAQAAPGVGGLDLRL